MDQGVPPPPGGYGLPPENGSGEPPQAAPPRPNIVPPARPPVSPFRENYYVPPANNSSGKRWAFGGIGAAILGVRLLLLCGRLADSGSNDYDYSYNPSTYPTYDPNAFAALFDASIAPSFSPAAQEIAVASNGTAYWLSGDQITMQGTDSKDVLGVHDFGKPIPPDLAYAGSFIATDKSLVWRARPDAFALGSEPTEPTSSLAAVPLTGGAPKVIVKGITVADGLVFDGHNLFFTDLSTDSDDRILMRVPPSGGTPVKVASWSDPFELHELHSLALDATNVYFVRTSHDPKDETVKSQNVSRMAKSGGAPKVLVTLPQGAAVEALAVTKGGVFFTASDEDALTTDARTLYKVPVAGGDKTTLLETTGVFGDMVADDAAVFVSRREGGTWSILRVTSDGRMSTQVGGLAREPHFGLTKDLLVWSTGVEVSSQSKSTSVP